MADCIFCKVLCPNLSMVIIDSLTLIFPCGVFVDVFRQDSMPLSLARKTHFTKPLTIASMIALQVVNIVWISFKRMHGKLLPPLSWRPLLALKPGLKNNIANFQRK